MVLIHNYRLDPQGGIFFCYIKAVKSLSRLSVYVGDAGCQTQGTV